MAWSFLQSFSSIGANLTHFVKHFTFFSTFGPPKVPIFWTFFNRIISFWKNQTLGPLKNERSQNSASKSLLNSSGDLNATHLVMKKLEKFTKWCSQIVFPPFSRQDGFLATWDPYKMKDLKILHLNHCSTAPETLMRPCLCRFKVSNFMLFLFFSSFFSCFSTNLCSRPPWPS